MSHVNVLSLSGLLYLHLFNIFVSWINWPWLLLTMLSPVFLFQSIIFQTRMSRNVSNCAKVWSCNSGGLNIYVYATLIRVLQENKLISFYFTIITCVGVSCKALREVWMLLQGPIWRENVTWNEKKKNSLEAHLHWKTNGCLNRLLKKKTLICYS